MAWDQQAIPKVNWTDIHEDQIIANYIIVLLGKFHQNLFMVDFVKVELLRVKGNIHLPDGLRLPS